VYDDGKALWAATRDRGLEGVVAKRRDSRYLPGRRSPDWVKVPHRHTQASEPRAGCPARRSPAHGNAPRTASAGGSRRRPAFPDRSPAPPRTPTARTPLPDRPGRPGGTRGQEPGTDPALPGGTVPEP